MSTEPESESQPEVRTPESELGLDLDLHFLPAWAQKSAGENKFTNFQGEEGGPRGRDRDRGGRDRRPPRRMEGAGRPSRPPGQGRPPGPGGARDRRPGGGDRRFAGPARGPVPQREEIKLPELEVTFLPEEKGVESLARQIKLSGRAYPLFEIGYLVLKKPERYHVQLTSKKKTEGQPQQLLYICDLDETLWLSEDEALRHILDKHFSTFYSIEKIPTDPPKGTYTFVAQCGISGTILGPPNYHDYQTKLRKLHQERFSRMPFDAFKSRIRIVRDEAVVKKWLDEQSFRTEYTCLNIPETIKLNTREEVEKHFRETHLPNVVKAVESYTLPGTAVHALQNRGLQALIRRSYDEQMRFPLKVVNNLSSQFARHGLQFFKVNKTVTHVAVARPRYLDMEATPVSEGVKKIVEFINTHPRTTRRKMIEALAPGAPKTEPAPPAPEGATPAPASEGAIPAPTPEGAPAAPVESNPEVSAIVSDLHWLIHQGHVLEFANGVLETAKRPAPRPQKAAAATPVPSAAPEGEAAHGEAAGEVTSTDVSADHPESEASEASPPPAPEASPEQSATVQDESGASAGGDVPQPNELPLSSGEEQKTA